MGDGHGDVLMFGAFRTDRRPHTDWTPRPKHNSREAVRLDVGQVTRWFCAACVEAVLLRECTQVRSIDRRGQF